MIYQLMGFQLAPIFVKNFPLCFNHETIDTMLGCNKHQDENRATENSHSWRISYHSR